MKNRILVVDDEPSMREMLAIMLFKEGFEVLVAESRAAAAKVFAQGTVDMVITDVKLPDGDGIEILRHVKSASPQTVVIVMTAFGSTETAVAALKLGAHDYLVKPFDVEELKIVVRGALESQHLKEENLRLRAELDAQHGIERIVATSPPMAAVVAMVRSVAPTGSTVLITGESGTGKELVAQAIHSLSPRRDAALRLHQLRRAARDPARERDVRAHARALSPTPTRTRRGCSRSPIAARCSSTKWGRCRRRCR